jgi:hypothetical protein
MSVPATSLPPRERRYAPDTPRPPHTAHLREFVMPDGRKLLADRRALAFATPAKPGEFGDKPVTILAFRTNARGCPVLASFEEIRAWWYGPSAAAA